MYTRASELPPAGTYASDFERLFESWIAPVEGWLSRDEAELLYRAARSAVAGAIVEIGAYRGRSTLALALGSRDGAGLTVYSVDPHRPWTGPGGGEYGPADREAFYRNVLAAGVAAWSRLVGLQSLEAARAIDGPLSLLFIDGDHTDQAVMQDVRAWAPKLAADGLLLMDDVSDSFTGPRRAVDRLLLEGWTQACEPVGKVVVLRPPRVLVDHEVVVPSALGGIRRQAAAELVTAARLDLGAKHLFARLAAMDPGAAWGRRIYLSHLRIWNGSFERVPRMRCADDYVAAFERILADTAASTPDGLDTVIPVTLDGSALNGAHRIAAALLHQRPVRTIPVEVVPDNARYNGAYFEGLLAARGGADEPGLVLAMCLEFVRIAPDCRLVLLFAHTEQHREQVDAEIAAHGEVVWTFVRRFASERERRALVRLMYEGEAWLGEAEAGFPGSAGKAEACFAAGLDVRFILLWPHRDHRDPSSWAHLKSRIRALCNVGNHSVHITDTAAEVDRLLRTAADASAFALYADAWSRVLPGFVAQFRAFRALIQSQQRQTDVVITGSAVMALFGLRDSADLDYLHVGPAVESNGRGDIASHNAYAGLYPATVTDMVEDPGLHVVVDGVRFLRPSVLAAFKRRRGEAKDQSDLALLDRLTQADAEVGAARPIRRKLWLVDGGLGHAHRIARMLRLRSDLPTLLDLDVLSAADIADSDAWIARLAARPGHCALVVVDGLSEAHPLRQTGERLPQEKLLSMTWAAIDGWRDSFLSGLSAFAGLPQDVEWMAKAQRHWDAHTDLPS